MFNELIKPLESEVKLQFLELRSSISQTSPAAARTRAATRGTRHRRPPSSGSTPRRAPAPCPARTALPASRPTALHTLVPRTPGHQGGGRQTFVPRPRGARRPRLTRPLGRRASPTRPARKVKAQAGPAPRPARRAPCSPHPGRAALTSPGRSEGGHAAAAQVEGAGGPGDARGEARQVPPRAAAAGRGDRGPRARALPVREGPTRGDGGQARGGHEQEEEQRRGT